LVDYELGFEIYVDIYYDPATWDLTKYNAIGGRGDNTSLHSGLFMPGVTASNYFYGWWRSTTSNSAIIKTDLTADWYRYYMIVTETTVQIKLLNLRTGVLLSGNVATVGTIDTADNINFTFLCYGINGLTGAYGSVGVNVANIRITRGSTCLLNIPLSEGVSDKVTDICNSSQYQITFINPALTWAKLSDYFHWNFRYGFTLYQKSGSANLYIPNDQNQNEITPSSVPSGYSKTANYKSCQLTFNQCESVFVLDNTEVNCITLSGALTPSGYNGDYIQNGTNAGFPKYDKIGDPSKNIWKSDAPYNVYGWAVGDITLTGYFFENINGDGDGLTPLPTDVVKFDPFLSQGATGEVTAIAKTDSDLYIADVDHFLFTESTGVAKELTIQNIDVDDGFDRGHLYINPNANEKKMMLYKTDKTLLNDVKIIKYIGIGDEIVYDESGDVVYDENDHAILE